MRLGAWLLDMALAGPLAFFGAKPSLILKGGMIAAAPMGDPNASIPTPQPVHYRHMFGAFGGALGVGDVDTSGSRRLDGVDPDSPGANGSTFPPLQEYPGILKGGSYKGTASEAQRGARLLSDPVWKQRDPQFPRSKWWFTDAPFAGFRVVRPLDPPPPEDYEIYWDVK
mgnify:CR=1 FL=1